jgi:hypothetical protein
MARTSANAMYGWAAKMADDDAILSSYFILVS